MRELEGQKGKYPDKAHTLIAVHALSLQDHGIPVYVQATPLSLSPGGGSVHSLRPEEDTG